MVVPEPADLMRRRGPMLGIAGAISIWLMNAAIYANTATLPTIVTIFLAGTSVGALLGYRAAARGMLGITAMGAGIGIAYLGLQWPGLTTPWGDPVFPFADGPALFVLSITSIVFCASAWGVTLRAQRRKTWPWGVITAT